MLYAPRYDLNSRAVAGTGHDDRTETLCGSADSSPSFHIHPSKVVDFGTMIVLVGDKRRLLCDNANRTRL